MRSSGGLSEACPSSCSAAMADYLHNLTASHLGHVVMVSVFDEGSNRLGEEGYAALLEVLLLSVKVALLSICLLIIYLLLMLVVVPEC